jgi:hypothetical protein
MTARTRLILRALVVLIWLLFAWQGISGGVSQLSSAETLLQRAQTFIQLGYGIIALLVVASTFRASAFARYVRIAWAVAVTLAAGLAPVAWGGTGWGPGTVAAVVGLGMAAIMLWFLRTSSRPRSGRISTESERPPAADRR